MAVQIHPGKTQKPVENKPRIPKCIMYPQVTQSRYILALVEKLLPETRRAIELPDCLHGRPNVGVWRIPLSPRQSLRTRLDFLPHNRQSQWYESEAVVTLRCMRENVQIESSLTSKQCGGYLGSSDGPSYRIIESISATWMTLYTRYGLTPKEYS